jgi:glycosyltransferase involved in cell wall biosynthesis
VAVLRPALRLPTTDLTRLVANLGYRRRARGLEPDLVVGFDLDGFLSGWPGCPYVVALKGVAADEMRFERGWSRTRFRLLAGLERRNARRADRVITTSEYSRQTAIEAYGLRPEDVAVVPEGIDVESWLGGAGPAPVGEHPVVVSVARQYPRKNTSTLIRAMTRVVDSVPAARLKIIGDGPELRRLKKLVGRLDLEETVDLVGSLSGADGIREELARATVFCLPSRQEGFGIVFLEAMAAGLAIVAADCGAVPEVAPHGEVSLLVEPDDVDGLAEALILLLREPDLRRRLAEAGSARWQRFDWPHVARLFLAEAGLE